jgi:hypothetical protein
MNARPVACSLSGSDQQARFRDLAEFGTSNLVTRTADEGAQRLRFRRSPENEAKLRSIIAAEEGRCPFLDFDLSQTKDELVLGIDAAEDGRPVADELAAVSG